ncbi:hypothetical protein BKA93DRAFT_574286 [Sparassis latifolia]
MPSVQEVAGRRSCITLSDFQLLFSLAMVRHRLNVNDVDVPRSGRRICLIGLINVLILSRCSHDPQHVLCPPKSIQPVRNTSASSSCQLTQPIRCASCLSCNRKNFFDAGLLLTMFVRRQAVRMTLRGPMKRHLLFLHVLLGQSFFLRPWEALGCWPCCVACPSTVERQRHLSLRTPVHDESCGW